MARSQVHMNSSATAAMQVLGAWQESLKNGLLPLDMAVAPVGALARVELDSDVEFRVWSNRQAVDALLSDANVAGALTTAVNSSARVFSDTSPSELAARAVLLLSDAVDVVKGGRKAVPSNHVTRTEILEDLRDARKACRKLRSTVSSVQDVVPAVRELERKARRASQATLAGAVASKMPTLLSKQSRTAMLNAITSLEAELEEMATLLKADIQSKRQRGGKVAQYRSMVSELSTLTACAFGNELGPQLHAKVVAEIFRSLNPAADFTDEAVRKLLF